MSNTQRGKVELQVGEKIIILHFTTNSIADAEDKFERPFLEMVNELQMEGKQFIRTLRAILWCGLIEEQPEITLRETGDLMDIYGHAELGLKLTDAINKAFPDDTKKKLKKGKRNQPRPK